MLARTTVEAIYLLFVLPKKEYWYKVMESFLENIKMCKEYYVYIMTNMNNTVLYTGVTNDLHRRVHEHKSDQGSAFTKKYKITKLVYYESGSDINDAIAREKQIKGGSRKKKVELIDSFNPGWVDLFDLYFG